MPPAISIITPTGNRESLLRLQHQNLASQSVQDFEWLILDDGPEPSAYFSALSDPRIHYRHHAGARLSIGAKRNLLADEARAPLIAHFDDDDFYGGDYLAVQMKRMADPALDIAKLAGWFVYSALHGVLGYWETGNSVGLHFRFSPEGISAVMVNAGPHAQAFQANLSGYGFSYVYRKTVWEETPFPDVDFAEDFRFVSEALAKGRRMDAFPDLDGICLHILRKDNMSVSYPQYLLPRFFLRRLFPGALALIEA